MPSKPIRASKVAQHYGLPSRPYSYGKARVKLALCPVCRCWLPRDHTCRSSDE